VDAVTSVYAVQAQEVGRRGGRFWAKDVKHFEDKAKGVTLSAREIEGNIEGEEIKDLTAVGNVVVKQRTSQGETTLSGNKAVYSKGRGTITVTAKRRLHFRRTARYGQTRSSCFWRAGELKLTDLLRSSS